MTKYATGGPVRKPGPVLLLEADEIVPIRRGAARCPHAQAEPVVLVTGELVACVCISCLRALPFDWIQDQRSRAEREAYCTHEDEADISSFGQMPGSDMICVSCSRRRKS